ncbi:TfpX/TfpZ family type IV pilin accessory protein [Caldimonas tepidiphila]|uniref:TfpX/TfpZ family type IV pilin accessory protein n=1 Tax=Caldimonas tepidiphila TaxID=2315841 RepID=UPI001F0B7D15|nr:TfpX/TfpZ family type IV pilin accessory protein [Caldimonas tepidiphila]
MMKASTTHPDRNQVNGTWDWRARLKAAGMHLGLSLLVALAAAAVVLGVWYPMPYREVSGGRELFMLLVAVDVVLGPLITLSVFDRRKGWRHLRRDLAVVALLQLGALGYGLHTVSQARPVYLAHEVDRFRVVRAVDIDSQELSQAPAPLQRLPWTGPQVIGTRVPTDPQEQLRAAELAMAGVDLGLRPAYWKPYDSARDEVLARSKPLTELARRHPGRAAEVEAAAARAGRSPAQLRYLPLIARGSDWVMLLDAQSADVVGYAPFDGFE